MDVDSPPDGHAWTVIACDGGEFSPSYGVFNLFQPDGSVYSSAPGRSEDVNIVLRYEGPGPFTLTGVTCVAPSAGFTSPLGQAVVFTSWDMPDVRRLHAHWSHVSSQQQFDSLAAQHHAQQHKDMQRWVSILQAQRSQAPAPASPCPPPPRSHQGSGLLAGSNPNGSLAGSNPPSHAAVARQQAAGRLALLLAAATADDARNGGHASSSSSSAHGALTPGMSAAAGVSAASSALAMCYGWEATWRVHMQALAMQMQAHVQAQMVAAQAMQAHVQAHAQAMHSLQAHVQPQGLQQAQLQLQQPLMSQQLQMQMQPQVVPLLQQPQVVQPPQVLQHAPMFAQLHAQPLQVHQPTHAAQLATAVQLPHIAVPGLAPADSMQQQQQQQLLLQQLESQPPHHPQLQLQVQPPQMVAQPWHQIPLTPHPPLAQQQELQLQPAVSGLAGLNHPSLYTAFPLTPAAAPMLATPQLPALRQQQQEDHMPQAAALNPNPNPSVTLPRVSSKTLDVPAAASSPPPLPSTDVVMAAIPPRWSWDVLDPEPAQNRPRNRHWGSREAGAHGAAEHSPVGGRWAGPGAGGRILGGAHEAGAGGVESSGEENGDEEGEGAPPPWSTMQLLHANRHPHPASHSPGRRPHQVRLHATHGLLPPASDAGDMGGLLPFGAGGALLHGSSSSDSDGSSEGGSGSSADRDGSSDGAGGSSAAPLELSFSEELPSPWSTLTSTIASPSPTLGGPLHPLTLASPLRPLRPELHQQQQHQQLQQLQQYQQQYLQRLQQQQQEVQEAQRLQQLRQQHAASLMGLPAGVLAGMPPAAAQLPFSHPPHPNSSSSSYHRGGSSSGAGCGSGSSEDMQVDVPLPPSPPCPAAFIDLLDCSHATVAVDPPLSGRYVLIKLLRSKYTYADNLDTTFLGLHVQRGPHAFGSVEYA